MIHPPVEDVSLADSAGSASHYLAEQLLGSGKGDNYMVYYVWYSGHDRLIRGHPSCRTSC